MATIKKKSSGRPRLNPKPKARSMHKCDSRSDVGSNVTFRVATFGEYSICIVSLTPGESEAEHKYYLSYKINVTIQLYGIESKIQIATFFFTCYVNMVIIYTPVFLALLAYINFGVIF
jgi:hypothetical protein